MTLYNKDIDNTYNDLISDYFKNGYIASPTIVNNCRRGTSTSCLASIELVNPKIKDKVIRIFVDRDDEMAHVGSMHEYVRYTLIYVKQYNYTKEDRKNNRTLWHDEGEMLFSKKYYHIPNSNAYTETLEEISAIYTIRENRIKQQRESKLKKNVFKWINLSDLKPETIDSIMARINRMHGFKAATASCIQKIGIRNISVYNYNLRREVPRVESLIYVDYKSKATTICLR
jgi:hypothetical protein